ncbi:hypothetical protein ACIGKR_23895 [Rhodococcus qingshengii]|uniref:hypothetical protein n=1 Tax=Rhodococcus qingshengii TaxID=334542 RepID=UPI0037C5F255
MASAISIAQIDDSAIRFRWREMVVREPSLKHSELRVLLELESHASEDGTNARPGVLGIAQALSTDSAGAHGHLSEKSVRTGLARGVELGFIIRVEQGRVNRGRTYADVYELAMPREYVELLRSTGTRRPPDAACEVCQLEKERKLDKMKERYKQSLLPETALPPETDAADSCERDEPALSTGNSETSTGNGDPFWWKLRYRTPAPVSPAPISSASDTPGPVADSEALAGEVLDESSSVGVADHGLKDVSSDIEWFRKSYFHQPKYEKRFGELVSSGLSRLSAASAAVSTKEYLPQHHAS